MVRGAEHSAPLKVKYQRLHASFPWVLRVPIQYTWRAVSEKFLVNTHSCAKNKNNNNNYNYNNKKTELEPGSLFDVSQRYLLQKEKMLNKNYEAILR